MNWTAFKRWIKALSFDVDNQEHPRVGKASPARAKIFSIKADDRRFSHLNQSHSTQSGEILASPFGNAEKTLMLHHLSLK
jgi:hypothetical protein